MFLMEIQKFYEKEFLIGLKALEIINHNFNVTMPEDEATFIAMHIIKIFCSTSFDGAGVRR